MSGSGANAQSRVSTEKLIVVHSRAFRRPIRSLTVPAANAPIIMPTNPITEITDAELGVSAQSPYLSSDGSTAPTRGDGRSVPIRLAE